MQEFQFGVVVVDQDILNETLETASVVYVGGPIDNQLVGFVAA